MTEADWQTATEPTPMLEFLRGKACDRKLRLFAVACCRQIWRYVSHDASRRAIEISEQYADGEVRAARLRAVRREAEAVASSLAWEATHMMQMKYWAARDAAEAVARACESEVSIAPAIVASKCRAAVMATPSRPKDQAGLLRDIFGNPFRPVTADPRWLTSAVAGLARAIYDERAFDRLPILADALEEAGCGNADVLAHCRQPGGHVRGCWAVDLLLGKG